MPLNRIYKSLQYVGLFFKKNIWRRFSLPVATMAKLPSMVVIQLCICSKKYNLVFINDSTSEKEEHNSFCVDLEASTVKTFQVKRFKRYKVYIFGMQESLWNESRNKESKKKGRGTSSCKYNFLSFHFSRIGLFDFEIGIVFIFPTCFFSCQPHRAVRNCKRNYFLELDLLDRYITVEFIWQIHWSTVWLASLCLYDRVYGSQK